MNRTKQRGGPLVAGTNFIGSARASRWPARLDVIQSASGLVLALFMWGHMFFVSSILLGNDVMWTITKFFEGYFLFGRSYPALVSCVVATVFALIVAHAFLALRKFPINYRQYATFRDHMKGMRHEDTTLWYWQAVTGFAMFFLASPPPRRDADAAGPHRSVRVVRPHVERPFLAALSRPALRGGAAWRHRSLPARGQVGMARGARSRTRRGGA